MKHALALMHSESAFNFSMLVHDSPCEDVPLYRGASQVDAVQDQLKMRD
jgi:hypothetical protein